MPVAPLAPVLLRRPGPDNAPAMTSSLSAISLSGMNAAQTALGVSAHNLANLSTAGFRRQHVTQGAAADGSVTTSLSEAPQEGNDLTGDLVGQLVAKNQFLANLAVFKAGDQMMGSLLDVVG
ncbi:MAG: flagellar basal body protein [Rubrivivax sp.]